MKKRSHICFFRSTEDLYYNMETFGVEKNPLLYITGLSGSGKTTLAIKVKEQYNVDCISLDALKFYDDANLESQIAVDSFVVLYPGIDRYIQKHWNTENNRVKNELLFTKYTCLFHDFLVDYAKKEKKAIILEGIQPIVRLPKDTLLGKPRIIKGTSSIQSFYNAYQRDKPLTKHKLFTRFCRYSIFQFFLLNIRMLYWKRFEK